MTRNPELEQLRTRCLELAVEAHAIEPVEVAKTFYDFILDQEPKTPRQLIDAALEAADVR